MDKKVEAAKEAQSWMKEQAKPKSWRKNSRKKRSILLTEEAQEKLDALKSAGA